VNRREFITLFGGAAAWPLAARAQQVERALVNWAADDAEGQARLAAFEQGLQQLGWTVGSNVRIDYRWAARPLCSDCASWAGPRAAMSRSSIAARDASSAFPRSQTSSLQDARTLVAVARAPDGAIMAFQRAGNLENVG
jgi:hypothetical protein